MISIIIPTLNEESYIGPLLSSLSNHERRKDFEVIVADGGSRDRTITIAREHPDVKVIKCRKPSRACQMNQGSQSASGDILYFVHADVGLVPSFVDDIEGAVASGHKSGCYSCKFVDPSLFLLKVNAWFTQFQFSWSRGGDQTLFITKEYFYELGGYDETAVIMEDYFLIDQLLERGSFKVLNKKVKISARKYKSNSYLKVQFVNLKAMRMYRKGERTEDIKKFYEGSLHH